MNKLKVGTEKLYPFNHGALKRLRISKGLTQRQALEKIRKKWGKSLASETMLARWEKNVEPRAGAILLLLQVYGAKITDVLKPPPRRR